MPRLWVDQDGVLASFMEGHFRAFGFYCAEKDNDAAGPAPAWHLMQPDFYSTLPPMHDFDVLWEAIRHRVSGILTALPKSGTANVALAKFEWARRYCRDTPVIVCPPGVSKASYCQPGDVLVDDWEYKHRAPWEAAGGVFVHHENAEATVAKLQSLGVV